LLALLKVHSLPDLKLTAAINFTTLFKGASLMKNSIVEVDWTSVDTDPTTLSIYLVNFVQWPPLTFLLAEDGTSKNCSKLMISVPTSDGMAHVRIPCNVDST